MTNIRCNICPYIPYLFQRGKRRRVKTKTFDFEEVDNEEKRLLQLAMKNSQLETTRAKHTIPTAFTYYPTVEEFKNPIAYIAKIRPEAERCGICKIVPPLGWNPTCQIDVSNPRTFPTKRQRINTLQEGVGFEEGKTYNFQTYKTMAEAFAKEWSDTYYGGVEVSEEILARDYWDMVEMGTGFVTKRATVDYANDIDTVKYSSGFPRRTSTTDQDSSNPPASSSSTSPSSSSTSSSSSSSSASHHLKTHAGVEAPDCPDMFSEDYYLRTGWNLINIASTKGSVLAHLNTGINGINVPWLYIGMLFASFCWHNEDNYLYSINYSHFGATKQWYGVPGAEAKNFEKISKTFLAESFRESPDLLHHMTTQISPNLLYGRGVPVYSLKQEEHTFIITFPKAFHCGFSYGFNCGEAVNFAPHDWLKGGGEADERYRVLSRNSVFSHQRLLFTLLQHKEELPHVAETVVLEEVRKVIVEEITTRTTILSSGVRDISHLVHIPPNNFDCIDQRSCDYDDLRSCHSCKHICLLTAVACECDKHKVACVRHYNQGCRCAREKKYMLSK